MTKPAECRPCDVVAPQGDPVAIYVNGKELEAYEGETVLSALLAYGKRAISKNEAGVLSGAYCSMGVCFSCCVFIDGMKRRSCQVVVQKGMVIQIGLNHSDKIKLLNLGS